MNSGKNAGTSTSALTCTAGATFATCATAAFSHVMSFFGSAARNSPRAISMSSHGTSSARESPVAMSAA